MPEKDFNVFVFKAFELGNYEIHNNHERFCFIFF